MSITYTSCLSRMARWMVFCSLSICMGSLWAQTKTGVSADPVVVTVDKTAIATGVPRLGLNLGSWTYWGAEQLMSNVLKNPGFEGTVDRSIVNIRWAEGLQFEDDEGWLGADDHFWDSASFDVVTGPRRGLSGVVKESIKKGPRGFPLYTADRPLTGVLKGDVVVLTRHSDPKKPAGWWISKPNEPFIQTLTQPYSPEHGTSLLKIQTRLGYRAELFSFLDSSGNTAGRLMPVQGPWKFSIQGKALAGKPEVRVSLARGGHRFFEKSWQPGQAWSSLDIEFSGDETATLGDSAPVQLTISSGGVGAEVALDNVQLGPAVKTAFRPEVIALLKQLHPGYLRDWQGQLGDTVANRLARPTLRKGSRYRSNEEAGFFYGLDEFVDLCGSIDAIPWIIIPSTTLDSELDALADFVRNKHARHPFKQWVFEFGNENWNPLFRSAGFVNNTSHAQRTQALYSGLRDRLTNIPHQFLLNIQPANPQRSVPEGRVVQGASDMALATAPYYFRELQDKATDTQIIAQLFPQDEAQFVQEFKPLGPKPLWLYEYNMHTTQGNAGSRDRVRAVGSMMAGNSLAHRAVAFYDKGVYNQAVYTFSQLSAFTEQVTVDNTKLVPLWGLVRDFAFPTMRPTGLAMQMLNTALGGTLYKLSCEAAKSAQCRQLTLLAFEREDKSWSVIVSNAGDADRTLSLTWPSARPPAHWTSLVASDPWANNETPESGHPGAVTLDKKPLMVTGDRSSYHVTLTIPAYRVGVMTDGPAPAKRR